MEAKETSISDDILNQAAEGAVGEEADGTHEAETEQAAKSEGIVEEVKGEKQEVVKEEKSEETDQQFRSKLGKRVSRIEDSMNSFINEMRMNVQKLNTSPETSPASESYITTEDDVKRVLSKWENEKLTATRNYENNYLDALAKLGMEDGMNDNEFMRLEELIKNAPLSFRDPAIDAERNYLKAVRVIEKEKLAKGTKQVNLKKDMPAGTGTVSGAKVIEKATEPVKLDKYAQEFVDYHKISDDKVRSALKQA